MTERTPTAAQTACFEAGIKFGSLYHQFAGTPVAPASADSIATAMADSIENQPHCESVDVTIDQDALEADLAESTADYTELTGKFLAVEIVVRTDEYRVETRMDMQDGYPLMRLESVQERS